MVAPTVRPRYGSLNGVISRKRVVIAGLGDSGVLTAIRLARHFDVVGISAKPALVSGQELGWRLSRPEEWARANWIPFDRFRALDRVRTVHGTLTGVDLDARTVAVRGDDGSSSARALRRARHLHRRHQRFLAHSEPAVAQRDRRRSPRRAHTPDRRRVGDRHRRRCRGDQQRRAGRHHLAGQARRPVLPRRARAAVAPPANLGEGRSAGSPMPAWGCTPATGR